MTGPDACSAEELLTGWVRDHGPAVRGYILALVRRPDVADDLTQDVFRKAWQSRSTYREQGTSRAWLLTIADRLVVDRVRRNEPVVHLDANGWQQWEPASEEDPLARLAFAEIQKQLEAALEVLSPIQKRVVLLRYYSDMSFAEIATAVGAPLNTVLSHCRRGLLALRKQLAEKPT